MRLTPMGFVEEARALVAACEGRVQRAYLFGSALTRPRGARDIDVLLVVPAGGEAEVRSSLDRIRLSRPVARVSTDDYDTVRLHVPAALSYDVVIVESPQEAQFVSRIERHGGRSRVVFTAPDGTSRAA